MTLENLNAAAQAMNDLVARMDGFVGNADDILAGYQAAYGALSSDLKGVVGSQMFFTATIDPDAIDPDEVSGGVFSSIAEAINAAPSGGLVLLYLLADKTYTVGVDIYMRERGVILRKSGAGANPVLAPSAYVAAGKNEFYGFYPSMSSALVCEDVDITLPAKSDAGLAWGVRRTLLIYGSAQAQKLIVRGGVVTGSDGQGLTIATQGSMVHLSVFNVTLDGDLYGVVAAASGVALVAKSALTLTNGAALTDGGSVGGNVLQNI